MCEFDGISFYLKAEFSFFKRCKQDASYRITREARNIREGFLFFSDTVLGPLVCTGEVRACMGLCGAVRCGVVWCGVV